jgi:AcrR family transcriptional regulator
MARVREAGMYERILDSAFQVFGERGFQATTIKDIAIGANISSGSIYTYFPDKEALFCATVSRGWQSFIDELEAIADRELDRAARVEALLDRGFHALSGAIPLIKGMLFDANRLNLVNSNLDRAVLAIEKLMAPDCERERLAWEEAGQRRRVISRMIILGVLCSAAIDGKPSPENIVERLREALGTLLSQAGIGARR